jgi:Skp family chaperone for outer membrane proteins
LIAAAQTRHSDAEAKLEAAIANVTRLLAKADDPDVAAELVAERRSMRAELQALQREAAGVVPIERAHAIRDGRRE